MYLIVCREEVELRKRLDEKNVEDLKQMSKRRGDKQELHRLVQFGEILLSLILSLNSLKNILKAVITQNNYQHKTLLGDE
jgi:hypothetical protein